ncbi:MAG: SsrA-binding protein SmpB [Endomicrobium sp.]|jgi:SsrA-binding protein|nr:SsrA-binding protein SmpB [Endomicrobium sp.]
MKKKKLLSNKKAYYNYEIFEKFESGIVLFGYEVKSLKKSRVNFVDSFVKLYNCEAFIENMFIDPYEYMSTDIIDYNPKRRRKLLMHKFEILKIYMKIKKRGFTAIPLEIYIGSSNKIKILIGLAKGKNIYDKREIIKKRDIKREISEKYLL